MPVGGGTSPLLALAVFTLAACASPSADPPRDTPPGSTGQAAADPPATAAPSGGATPEPAAATAAPSPTAAATAAPSGAPASGPCPAGMIFIAGGTLKRHKPGPKKVVTVAGHCIDRAEVTVSEYKECVKEKKCSPRCLEIGRCTAVPTDADWPDTMESIRASMFCNGARSDRDAHPVNCVSFDEAKGYCAARDKRLPTGDEWEQAIVGDAPAPVFPWGRTAPEGGDLCWGKPYKRPSTCLPGSFPRDTTRDGVVDMTGNLSEWVIEGTPERPRPRLRGASWYSIDDGYVQAAMWGFESTSTRSEVFGFRCAKDAAPRP